MLLPLVGGWQRHLLHCTARCAACRLRPGARWYPGPPAVAASNRMCFAMQQAEQSAVPPWRPPPVPCRDSMDIQEHNLLGSSSNLASLEG